MALNNSIDSNFNALTAGGGINLSNTAGNVTISTTGAAAVFPLVTFTSVGTTNMVAFTRYYSQSNTGNVKLPASAILGDVIIIYGEAAFNVLQNAGQSISFSGQTTTAGVGGSLFIGAGGRVELLAKSTTTWFVSQFTPGDSFSVNTSFACIRLI